MLINKEKYPIIDFVNGREITIPYIDGDHFLKIHHNQLLINELGSLQNKNIDFLSNSFIDAMLKSIPSFKSIFNSANFIENLNESGAFIFRNIGVSYNISNCGISSIWFINGVCAIVNTENITFRTMFRDVKNHPFVHSENDRVSLILCYLVFKKYAKVDIRLVNRKSKRVIGSEKYSNKSDLNINILDCTWFTTIVRNEGFSVMGHFRLQPQKDTSGNWTKRLIYINEFRKHGYTKKAKILSD